MPRAEHVKVNLFSLAVGETFRKCNSEARTIYKVKGKSEGVVFYDGVGRSFVAQKDKQVIITKIVK